MPPDPSPANQDGSGDPSYNPKSGKVRFTALFKLKVATQYMVNDPQPKRPVFLQRGENRFRVDEVRFENSSKIEEFSGLF